MNEELQTAITKLITTTLDGADKATDFLSAEVPEYINQLILYYATVL